MNCPDWGYLQAYIDGEIGREERKQIAIHLEQCAACRELMHELRRLEEWTEVAIHESMSAPAADSIQIDVDRAWHAFQERISDHQNDIQPFMKPVKRQQTKGRWISMKNTYTKWLSGAAAVALLAGSLAIPSVQVAASNFLTMFRMDKTELIRLSDNDLHEIRQWMEEGGDGGKELAGLGKMEMKDNKQETFKNEQAARKAGVDVPKAPKGYDVASVERNSDWRLTFELDTQKTNRFLKKLKSDVTFDDSLNGKEFSLTLPEQVRTYFEPTEAEGGNHITFTKSEAPSLEAPKDVDLDQLRETILQLPFIPRNVQKQLASIGNWKETLPIPYVEGEGEEIQIDGVNGLFNSENNYAYAIWQKDGKMYQLEAWGNSNDKPIDQEAVMDLIEQLKK
ncbi:anti-sigma factor family protein [Brevibacillus sp. SYSU BS000544]|uniref:anti-sigma factor family protein n=1 Tax=Brevibacillus sp. SYSU BS000544 TaxID=3416443 RepID=UPI003CE5BC71